MKKTLLTATLLSVLALGAQQINHTYGKTPISNFDYNQALNEAKAKGVQAADWAGYVELKHKQWMKANGIESDNHQHNHSAFKIIAPTNNTLVSSNIDFETGDYTGWLTLSGENTVNSNGPLQNLLPMVPGPNDTLYGMFNNNCPGGTTNHRQGLISSTVGNDPIGGFPIASPMGGNYVARVNSYCAMMEAAMLTQTFTPSIGETWLNYAYAVVLEDGGHMQGEQTYFSAYVLDANGDTIPGSFVYMQAANGTTPGFYPSTNPSYYATYYKPWTPVSVDLSAYMGQSVTVVYIASGCIYSGHSGYAYVDARLDSVAGPAVVWPGDMNYDLTADINDLLYMGWAYGSMGSIRAGATINWQAEASANWSMSGPYGVDYKHADANGDGTIDLNDTTALVQNYGLVHTYKLANPVNNPLATRSLGINPSVTSISPGQTFYIDVDLSSSGISTADSLFSISFNVNTPAGLLSNLSSTDFSNSFVGIKNNTMAAMSKDMVAGNNLVPVGITRINHSNVIGSGNLVRLYFTAGNWAGTVNGTFTISNINLVTNNGSYVIVNGGSTTLNFMSGTLGIANINSSASITLYPNPAKDVLMINGLKENNRFEIINILGEVVMNANTAQINISSLAKGHYFVRIHTANGMVVKKFVKE